MGIAGRVALRVGGAGRQVAGRAVKADAERPATCAGLSRSADFIAAQIIFLAD